ncbi:MAG: hypothetical protein A2603_02945 [Bdellovibrionales bacterium RIFOXYD1_FULL_55_31]|nr:MAG: hypothetical protein A2603_02945 [Bdellovibrionales bacterium RIFOXYD1_FULL_55_31]
MKKAPDIAKLFKRIVIMGGWKANRLGYNSIIDYAASKAVFTLASDQKLSPIVLANSESLAEKQLDLDAQEIESLVLAAHRSKFGSALVKDMRNWRRIYETGKTMTGVSLADPLAVFVAKEPNSPLLTYSCYKLTFRNKPSHSASGGDIIPGETFTMFTHAELTPPMLEKREIPIPNHSKNITCPSGTIQVLNKIQHNSDGEVPLRKRLVSDLLKKLNSISDADLKTGMILEKLDYAQDVLNENPPRECK